MKKLLLMLVLFLISVSISAKKLPVYPWGVESPQVTEEKKPDPSQEPSYRDASGAYDSVGVIRSS